MRVARAHRKVQNQRRDFHHKTALALVRAYGAIAVETLNTAGMVRHHGLAKSISDASWAQFIAILTHKAAGAGVVVVAVNPAGTSQLCRGCGRTVPKTLSERWHTCPYADCGISLQRDHNAARNILHRAGPARAVAVAPAAESQGGCATRLFPCTRVSAMESGRRSAQGNFSVADPPRNGL